ncbi:hypothetical protein [Microcoleus sp. herbarium12]|uniref:hypothetical protein n=1 Tax=Microcoleus sp. herbarium12 TaxID=3055437 RepID=UPI002FCECE8A
MQPPATHQPEATSLQNLSSQSLGWKHILVEQFYEPPGECNYDGGDRHTINLSLAPRPVCLLQIQG